MTKTISKNKILEAGFVKDIQNRISNDLDAIIIVEGPEGSGKSTGAIHYAFKMDKEFSLNHIIYSMENAVDLVYSLPKGSVIIWDEACYDMSRRDAMTKTNKEIIKLAMATRSRNLIHLICIPHMEDLETYIVERRACYTISVFMVGDKRGFFTLKIPIKYRDKYGNLKTKWIPMFKKMRFGKLPDDIDNEYKMRKEKYSRAKMEDIVGTQKKDDRYHEYKELKEMGLKDNEIAKKWAVTPAAVCQWKKKWGLIG